MLWCDGRKGRDFRLVFYCYLCFCDNYFIFIDWGEVVFLLLIIIFKGGR